MIAFAHINKTGGTTMKFILRNSFGVHHCDVKTQHDDGTFRDEELQFARWVFPGLRSIAGHHLRHPSTALSGDIDFLTVLREPVMRFASHFQQNSRRTGRTGRWWKAGGATSPRHPLTLEQFVQKSSNLQVRCIVGAADVERAKKELQSRYFFVGLTERFDESVRVLEKLCPYPLDPRYRRSAWRPIIA